jgi:hypothetical protein
LPPKDRLGQMPEGKGRDKRRKGKEEKIKKNR